MSTTVDGFELLQVIGANPDVFGALREDVTKAAKTIAKKRLKAIPKIEEFRQFRAALTPSNLEILLDELVANEIKTLLKKLDPHYPALASASELELRRHLLALGAGEVEPAAKSAAKAAEKPGKAAKPKGKSKKNGVPFFPESMSAKPSRYR